MPTRSPVIQTGTDAPSLPSARAKPEGKHGRVGAGSKSKPICFLQTSRPATRKFYSAFDYLSNPPAVRTFQHLAAEAALISRADNGKVSSTIVTRFP